MTFTILKEGINDFVVFFFIKFYPKKPNAIMVLGFMFG